MSTTLPDIATDSESAAPAPSDPALPILIERLPHSLWAPRALALFTAVLGATYWRLSFRPLWHTDIWGHLSYGRLIWNAGALPATDPLMPLSAGVPLVDTAWLSELIGYGWYCLFGPAGLQFLFASSITLCLGLLAWRMYARTQGTLPSLGGLAVFGWLVWQQLLVGWPETAGLLRPQLAGLVCFVLLFVILTGKTQFPMRRWGRGDWVVIPGLIAVWANLHGSFIIGLGLLGSFCLGHAIDLYRRTGSLKRVWRDARTRRLFLMTELAAAAALLNPYGIGLYAEVLTFSKNANLASLVDWDPLSIRTGQGLAAACIGLGLAIAYRFSPRRVTATEMLLLAGLGGWTLGTSRMLLWWAVPATYYFVLHAQAGYRKSRRLGLERIPSPRSGLWSAVSLGLIWIFFAGSSFGVRVLHGGQVDLKQSVSKSTPLGAVEYLRKHPPQGQVFNTYEWGDYLRWAGPEDMRIFVNSHAHLVPPEVWQHYLSVSNGGSGWDEILDRYSVNTVVIDLRQQEALAGRLREHTAWKVAYEDGIGLVATRKKAI